MVDEVFNKELAGHSNVHRGLKSNMIKQGSEEEDFILNVAPLKEVQEKEKQVCLQTQIFLRKHAHIFKKKLLLNALNFKSNINR